MGTKEWDFSLTSKLFCVKIGQPVVLLVSICQKHLKFQSISKNDSMQTDWDVVRTRHLDANSSTLEGGGK